jgi:hypothetical protein
LIGLLFWPGALLFITDNSIAYGVAMPFTLQFALFLALVILRMPASFKVLRVNHDSGRARRI